MLWSILLIKKNDNGWFINYIQNKLNEQISKLNLQNEIEVIIYTPKTRFYGKYVNIIEDIEIADNYISVIYNKIKNTNKDCVGLQGLLFVNDEPHIFNNVIKENQEFFPITKLNPIKKELIFNLKNIIYYINSENLSNITNSIEEIDKSVIFVKSIVDIERISIIITAYQTQDYIEDCLNSIEKQTYFINNDNFEVLIGVDGCQDTLDKLESIKHKYRNLSIYMMSENKGTYVTTNTLIDLVKNENVIRFDSDDIMTPNLVREVLKNKKDHDIVIFGSVELKDGVVDHNKFILTEGSIYFRKSVMDNIIGGYQPWVCAADTELIKRIGNKVKIHQLKKALFYRRKHPNSLTNSRTTGHFTEIRNNYKKQIKNHYKNDEIKIERVINNYKLIGSDNNYLQCIINREPINNPFESVKKFVLEKFEKDKKYNNSLVILGYNFNFDIDKLKLKNPNKKIIIYQLEQLFNYKSQWYNTYSSNKTIIERTNHINYILNTCDEIWDYDLDNIKFIKKILKIKNIKHVPLKYTLSLKKINNNNKPKYDIIFYGSLNDERIKKIRKIYELYKNIIIICPDYDKKKYKNEIFNNVMLSSIYGDKLFEYIFNSKIVLNLHYYKSKIQEQVRIFELLINNCTIVSEKSRINYFKELIYEFESDNDMINIIKNILKNNLWKNINISKKFEKMGKYKVGAIYNTFYGLEHIEKSINSIKNIVDYFIIIHQHHSIDLKTVEPKNNKEIIERLKNLNLNLDIVYHDPKESLMGLNNIENKHKFILEKRNLGLEYCKKNYCDFIIPLDTDERYDSSILKDEIDHMYENNIETLYSPIFSYYYDENHYFEDTYYVPSVYKVNDRIFEKTKTSILTDPVRKMKERTFKISKMHMHHYTYMKETYKDKMKNGLRTSNPNIKTDVEKIGEYLLNKWKEGDEALVFLNDLNDGGNTILSYVKLKKNENNGKNRF